MQFTLSCLPQKELKLTKAVRKVLSNDSLNSAGHYNHMNWQLETQYTHVYWVWLHSASGAKRKIFAKMARLEGVQHWKWNYYRSRFCLTYLQNIPRISLQPGSCVWQSFSSRTNGLLSCIIIFYIQAVMRLPSYKGGLIYNTRYIFSCVEPLVFRVMKVDLVLLTRLSVLQTAPPGTENYSEPVTAAQFNQILEHYPIGAHFVPQLENSGQILPWSAQTPLTLASPFSLMKSLVYRVYLVKPETDGSILTCIHHWNVTSKGFLQLSWLTKGTRLQHWSDCVCISRHSLCG